MFQKDRTQIRLHERLYKEIEKHIQGTSFGSVSDFVHHVMADICSTGDLAVGGDVPAAEAELIRRRLEALGYLAAENGKPLVPVHGGLAEPANLQVPPERLEAFIREAKRLDALALSREELCLLYRFGDGVLSPLRGPMVREDFERVLSEESIVRGGVRYAWTLPLAFRVSEEQAKGLKPGERLALIDDKNDIVGALDVEDVYPFDRPRYLESVYGTSRTDHPGARLVMRERRGYLVGGTVAVIPEKPNPLLSDLLLPAWSVRELIKNRRWERAVAFHAGAAPLRADEYGLVWAAEELTRQGHLVGLILNPLIGENEGDIVPALTRVKSYRALAEKRLIGKGDKDVELWKKVGYDLNDQLVLLGLDIPRFHAGPKEAVMHAIFRQNMGCSHLVIGPGHAAAAFDDGAPLFGELDAQEKFASLKGELRIEATPAGAAAYFAELGRIGLCARPESEGLKPLRIDEAGLRADFENGRAPDPRLVRPEAARILKADFDLYKTAKATNVTWHHSSITKEDREALNDHRGICIWYTGLSASGKSSIAHAVEARLYERGVRTYVLDGDNVRHGLNANLGFSPQDREENIRRIGHVSKLFAEGGVVVMTAFISPYRSDRDKVRGLMEPGDFIEVFVDCPVDVCEQRDPKGLYKKAKAGQIPEFTGISAPYEAPAHPEIHLDAGRLSIEECADEVVKYLEDNELIRRR